MTKNHDRKVNVEKGKQGFQETAKAEATGGLGGLEPAADDREYSQPIVFSGAPNEDTRFAAIAASVGPAGSLNKVFTNLTPERAQFHADAIREAWENGEENGERDMTFLAEKMNRAIGEDMSAGRVDHLRKVNPSWQEPTVDNDGSYNMYTGCKYVPGTDTKDAAKSIRSDIADAQKAGVLPVGKYSVRISRFAGGSAIDTSATVTGNTANFYDRETIGYDDRRLAEIEVRNRLDEISGQYTRTRVATGYNEGGGANFYTSSSFQVVDA
jgi:hypothetical protein